jgi:hypothetical protein
VKLPTCWQFHLQSTVSIISSSKSALKSVSVGKYTYMDLWVFSVLQYGAESIRVLHARTLPYSHLVVCLRPNVSSNFPSLSHIQIPALQQPPFAPPNHPNSIPLQCPPDPPASNSSPSLTSSAFQPEHAPFQPSSTIQCALITL